MRNFRISFDRVCALSVREGISTNELRRIHCGEEYLLRTGAKLKFRDRNGEKGWWIDGYNADDSDILPFRGEWYCSHCWSDCTCKVEYLPGKKEHRTYTCINCGRTTEEMIA